jgi:hypothetical protein
MICGKKDFSGGLPLGLRLRVAATSIIVFCLIAQTSQNQRLIPIQQVHAADEPTTTYWLNLAQNAWEYFQPGKGVDSATGLHQAGLWFPDFTDWDLGVYVQAIIDAKKLGLISDDGSWGANARFNKILEFLETRQRTPDGQPYVWYSSENGQNVFGTSTQAVEDAGKLLLSLNNLKLLKPDLAPRIDNIVYNLHNYEPLAGYLDTQRSSTSIYRYYAAMGFAGFWPDRFSPVANAILDNIIMAPTVSTYGVELPQSQLTCEPLLLSFFELPLDTRLQKLAKSVYFAHEARSLATGKYIAFSEGNTELSYSPYVYEYVILPDGQTWVRQDVSGRATQIPEIIYLKVAVSFLAIYNTTFARNMVDSLMARLAPALSYQLAGYGEGVDENGRACYTPYDKTNALIIGAARYAIESTQQNRLPSPNQSQYPSAIPIPPSTSTTASTPLSNSTEDTSFDSSSNSTLAPTPPLAPSESKESLFTAKQESAIYSAAATLLLVGTTAAFLFIKRRRRAIDPDASEVSC